MSSVIIKIDGVEVAMVRTGLSTSVINLKLPGRDYMGFRVSQILAGLVCVAFCWTSPEIFFGIWTGIPYILTGIFYIVSERWRHPGWLLASSIMNILSFLLSFVVIILFSLRWHLYHMEVFVIVGAVGGMCCSLQTLFPPQLGHTSQQTLVDTKPLLDAEPPACGEKQLTLYTD